MPGVVVAGRILIQIQSSVINLNRAPSEKQNANVFEKKSVLKKRYLKFRLRKSQGTSERPVSSQL